MAWQVTDALRFLQPAQNLQHLALAKVDNADRVVAELGNEQTSPIDIEAGKQRSSVRRVAASAHA